ncbi:hypothetical protein [Mesorhizobium sp. YM1C-6-2]|uniref:hypothetical protein n=1 Tax=Mesorhizobium sp. YM1C-6-2 TaxID=1827501 RepID=UPI0011C45DF7|nr:hypothetical protein [Mesorhizobium sp. YM1C-6-2]
MNAVRLPMFPAVTPALGIGLETAAGNFFPSPEASRKTDCAAVDAKRLRFFGFQALAGKKAG